MGVTFATARRPAFAVFAGLAAAALAACGGTVRSPTEPPPGSGSGGPGAQAFTFTQIQTGIFTPRCAKAGCHASSTASGGLVLDAGLAYGDIVGRHAQEQPQLAYWLCQ